MSDSDWTILVAAGIGSYCSGFLERRAAQVATVAAILCAVLIVSLRYALPAVTPFLRRQTMPMRILGVLLLVAPGAFCMGLPFPLAIRKLVAVDTIQ